MSTRSHSSAWRYGVFFVIAVMGLVISACGETGSRSETLRSVDTLAFDLPTFQGTVSDTLVKPRPEDPLVIASDSMFDTNQTKVKDAGRCRQIAVSVRDNRAAPYLNITGYADSRPTGYPGGNDQLSLDRALAIKQCLVDAVPELDSRIIQTSGAGIRCLFLPDNPTNANNRRVAITQFATQAAAEKATCDQ